MSVSTGQGILAIIESDVLTAAGSPLLAFLTEFGAAGGDPVKIALAWVKLQGGLIGGLPGVEVALAQQIASALQAKLTAAIQAIQAKVAPPPAAVTGTIAAAGSFSPPGVVAPHLQGS
jgi:aryl-alcohol dehydrogenase-like predicted oxidoreductase